MRFVVDLSREISVWIDIILRWVVYNLNVVKATLLSRSLVGTVVDAGGGGGGLPSDEAFSAVRRALRIAEGRGIYRRVAEEGWGDVQGVVDSDPPSR